MKNILIGLLFSMSTGMPAQEPVANGEITNTDLPKITSTDIVDGSVTCEDCQQDLIPIQQLSLFQMVEFVRSLPRTDWDHGHVAFEDLLPITGDQGNSIFQFLCRSNNPPIKIPRAEPSTVNRILMGVAEKSLGETVGETVGGNPTLFVGYKYIPPDSSTVDRVGEMFNFNNQLLSQEALIEITKKNTELFLKHHRSPRSLEQFGGLIDVSVEQARGGLSVNKINFQHITFQKDAGKESFHGTHRDGRNFTLYCTSQILDRY
jgi:hypothetical protein